MRGIPKPVGYILLGLVVVLSYLFARLFPVESALRAIASVPGAGALAIAAWQIFRDATAFERSLLLQRSQESFSLGATSHMAMVAFDKHVMFCEEYMEEMYKVLGTLFREGPTEEALKHSQILFDVRRKYAAWVTEDIARALDPYEKALREVGAGAHYVEATRLSGDERRSEAIDKMYRTYTAIMGAYVSGEARDPDRDADLVMGKLRSILGIEQLTQMRGVLVSRSLRNLS